MKEIVVISGKGGTGKTTFATSLYPHLPDAVLADCDVDAPDAHILLKPEETHHEDFVGTRKARIDPDICNNGGACGGEMPCMNSCRFEAILKGPEGPEIRDSRCEGCGVCALVCPADAIRLEDAVVGSLAVGDTAYGPMVHARLKPGEETSGKLVTAVRRKTREVAEKNGARFILADGSPGIGCPVISSLTGAALAVIVTEPSLSAMRDMERLAKLLKQFRIPATVVINKYDLSEELSKKIEKFCRKEHIPVGLKLPFNIEIVNAVTERKIPSLALPEFFRENGFNDFVEVLKMEEPAGAGA